MRCILGEGLLRMLANCFSEGGWCRGVTGGTRGSLKRLKGLFFKSKASVLRKSHKLIPRPCGTQGWTFRNSWIDRISKCAPVEEEAMETKLEVPSRPRTYRFKWHSGRMIRKYRYLTMSCTTKLSRGMHRWPCKKIHYRWVDKWIMIKSIPGGIQKHFWTYYSQENSIKNGSNKMTKRFSFLWDSYLKSNSKLLSSELESIAAHPPVRAVLVEGGLWFVRFNSMTNYKMSLENLLNNLINIKKERKVSLYIFILEELLNY